MTLLEPPKGPGGAQYATYLAIMPTDYWYITKDSANPEQAFRLGDYLMGYDAFVVGRYGEPGVDWTDDPAACEGYQGTYEESGGIKPKLVTLNNLWSKPQNKHWQGSNPAYLSVADARAFATTAKSPSWTM